MHSQAQQIEQVMKKLRPLPPERVAEVEDFIDFLSQRDADRGLTRAAMATAEPILEQVWHNPDDTEYEKL